MSQQQVYKRVSTLSTLIRRYASNLLPTFLIIRLQALTLCRDHFSRRANNGRLCNTIYLVYISMHQLLFLARFDIWYREF